MCHMRGMHGVDHHVQAVLVQCTFVLSCIALAVTNSVSLSNDDRCIRHTYLLNTVVGSS